MRIKDIDLPEELVKKLKDVLDMEIDDFLHMIEIKTAKEMRNIADKSGRANSALAYLSNAMEAVAEEGEYELLDSITDLTQSDVDKIVEALKFRGYNISYDSYKIKDESGDTKLIVTFHIKW